MKITNTMNILLRHLIMMFVYIAHASTFLLNNEGWMVNQCFNNVNKPCSGYAKHHETNTGTLNRYISGKDAIVNVDWKHKDDKDLWYFVSPPSLNKPVGK